MPTNTNDFPLWKLSEFYLKPVRTTAKPPVDELRRIWERDIVDIRRTWDDTRRALSDLRDPLLQEPEALGGVGNLTQEKIMEAYDRIVMARIVTPPPSAPSALPPVAISARDDAPAPRKIIIRGDK